MLKNKENFKKELQKVWSNEKMINYCLKEADLVIETSQGIFSIEKPKIKTRFCFGYDDRYEGSEKNASELARTAEKDVEYFKKENLKELNDLIQILKNKKEIYCNYYYDKSSEIKSWCCSAERWISGTPEVVSEETRTLLIEMYEEEVKRFSKRLDTYLKKYGLSKIYTWAYCSD